MEVLHDLAPLFFPNPAQSSSFLASTCTTSEENQQVGLADFFSFLLALTSWKGCEGL